MRRNRLVYLFCVFSLLSACDSDPLAPPSNNGSPPTAEAPRTTPACENNGSFFSNEAGKTSYLKKPKNLLRRQASKRFIVKLRDGFTADAIMSERISVLASRASENPMAINPISDDMLILETTDEETAESLEGRIGSDSIEYIEPDGEVYYALFANDPKISSQWAHKVVNSASAWDVGQGNKSVIVAVVDSGIDYTHEDLKANMWINRKEIANNGIDDDGNGYIDDIYGWDFANNDNRPISDDATSYHGTHVAGTIGAVGGNGIGISGHSPQVSLMALKFLNSSGSGLRSNAIKAIDYAIKNGARVISNSWGGYTYSQALYDAIGRAKKAGILFVAAAGNAASNNDSQNFYPANYDHDNVISVASSTSADKLSSFSNYGRATVDIAAPGSSIYSTKNGNSYQTLSGTSMATPLVTGVLATMIALRPDLDYRQIKSALLRSVDLLPSFSGKVASNGRINAFKAISAIANRTREISPITCP